MVSRRPNITHHTNTLSENTADVQERTATTSIAEPAVRRQGAPEVQQNFPIAPETAFLFLQHFIKMLKAAWRAGGDRAPRSSTPTTLR